VQSEDPSLARIGTFSDGVFAFTITLLILAIRIPHPTDAECTSAPSGTSLSTSRLASSPVSTARASMLLAQRADATQRRTTGNVIPVVRNGRPCSAKRERDLLEVVHRFLHAAFHAGVDDRVAFLLGRELHEEREGGAPVHFGERRNV
jgi:hypothetical protein